MLKRIINYTICFLMLISICMVDITAHATTIGEDVYYNLPINSGMDQASDGQYIDNQLGTVGDAELSQDRMYGDYSVKVTLESNSGDTDYTLVDSDVFSINNYSQVEIWVKPGQGSEWIEFSTATSSSKKYEIGEEIERGKWNKIILDLTEIQGALTQGEDLKVESNDSSEWYFDEVRSLETKEYSFNMSNMINSDTEISNGGLQFEENGTSTFDTTPTTIKSDELSISGEKEISKITIDREYADTSGDLSELPTDALYLAELTVFPTNFVISGNGNILNYVDPSDDEKIHRVDLTTNSSSYFTTPYGVEEMKTNFEGDYLAIMTDYSDRLYWYENSTSDVDLLASGVGDFDIGDNGNVYYEDDEVYVDGDSRLEISTRTGKSVVSSGVNEIGFFYVDSDLDNLYKFENTQDDGWEDTRLIEDMKNVSNLYTNRDGDIVYIKNDGVWYMYNLEEKSLRSIYTEETDSIYGITDDDKIMMKDSYDNFFLYDPDAETEEEILTEDMNYSSTHASFSRNGKKLAYLAVDSNDDANGIRVKYIGQIDAPESYLISFDDQQSWYSFYEGAWTKVSDSSTPSDEDFYEYGMTATEVNNLDKGDYGKLYEEFENIYSVSVSSYFASLDPFTTPSIKSIKVTACNDVDDYDRYKTKSNLYAAKKKDFDGSDWRKINKIYPLEIAQQSADFRYFIKKGTDYKVYKDGSFTTVSSASTYLSDVETNWIDITLEGMTAEELRSIPEDNLTTELAGESFSIIYALKVCDESTEEYSSMVSIDYTEDLFTITGMTLSITLYGSSTPVQYTNLTDTQVEDFMEWIHSRQYNYGPVFYRIDNGTTSEFINYYMIQKVSVAD